MAQKGSERFGVLVTNIPEDVDQTEFHTHMSTAGKVIDIVFLEQLNSCYEGQACCAYDTPEQAIEACTKLNTRNFQGNPLKVSAMNIELWNRVVAFQSSGSSTAAVGNNGVLSDDLSELENTFSNSSQTDLNTKKKVLERMVQIVRESGLYEVSHKFELNLNLNLGEPVVTGTQANPGIQANPGNLPLINPQTLQVSSQAPRLPTFTGDTPVKGGNTAYQVWRFEVSCLAKEECYQKPPGELKHAIRRSLKGKAAESIIYLGDNAIVDDILHKLDGLYGSVTKGCVLLKRFFNAQQQETESVTDWGCRLESLLNQAKDKGSVDPKDMNTLLCTQLYEGLYNAELIHIITTVL